MDLRIDIEKDIAYIRLSGPVSREMILGAFDDAVSDDRYGKGMGRLWDFREADLSAVDSHMIREMSQYSLKFPPGISDVKVAFVTGRSLEYGMSRMFQMVTRARTPPRVFHTMDEAELWMTESIHGGSSGRDR